MPFRYALVAILAFVVGCEKEPPPPPPKKRGPANPPKLSFTPTKLALGGGVLKVVPDGFYALPEKSEIKFTVVDDEGPALKGDLKISTRSKTVYPIAIAVGDEVLAKQTKKDEAARGKVSLLPHVTGARIVGGWADVWSVKFEGEATIPFVFRAGGYKPAKLNAKLPLGDHVIGTWLHRAAPKGIRLAGEGDAAGAGKGALFLYRCGSASRDALFGDARDLKDIGRIAVARCVDTKKRRPCSFVGGRVEMELHDGEVTIHERATGKKVATKRFPGRRTCPQRVTVGRGQKTIGSGVDPSPMARWVAKETGFARVTKKFGNGAK